MSARCTRIAKRTSVDDKASYFDDCHEYEIKNAAWNVQLDFYKLNIGILFTPSKISLLHSRENQPKISIEKFDGNTPLTSIFLNDPKKMEILVLKGALWSRQSCNCPSLCSSWIIAVLTMWLMNFFLTSRYATGFSLTSFFGALRTLSLIDFSPGLRAS